MCDTATSALVAQLQRELQLKDEIIASKNEIIAGNLQLVEAKDTIIATKNRTLQRNEEAMVDKQQLIEAQKVIIAAKDRVLQSNEHAMAGKQQLIEAKDATIVTKDELLPRYEHAIALLNKDLPVLQEHIEPSVSPPQKKRARAEARPVVRWDDDQMLEIIFVAMGEREWLYVASLSRRYRGLYLSFCKRAARRRHQSFDYRTDWRNAVLSASRVEMAFTHGLSKAVCALPESAFGTHVIQHSSDPTAVLALCDEMPWTEELATFAAQNEHRVPGLLQWVLDSDCPWDPRIVMRIIINSTGSNWPASLGILKSLWSRKPRLSSGDKASILEAAGILGGHKVAQWLRHTVDAPWPVTWWYRVSEREHIDLAGPPVRGTLISWSLNTFRWARAEGAPWGTSWRCQMFDEAWYRQGNTADDASDVFTWAHQHGCPCTCN